MSSQSIINGIVNNIIDTLRSAVDLEGILVNSNYSDNSCPAAQVCLEDVEYFSADDNATSKWGKAEIKIKVSTNAGGGFESSERVTDICEQIIDTLQEDPFRDGHCKDLPIGNATEICKLSPQNHDNDFALILQCHFETSEA